MNKGDNMKLKIECKCGNDNFKTLYIPDTKSYEIVCNKCHIVKSLKEVFKNKKNVQKKEKATTTQ